MTIRNLAPNNYRIIEIGAPGFIPEKCTFMLENSFHIPICFTCLSGSCDTVHTDRAWVQFRVSPKISYLDSRGACFEINFLGMQRRLDGVLYNL